MKLAHTVGYIVILYFFKQRAFIADHFHEISDHLFGFAGIEAADAAAADNQLALLHLPGGGEVPHIVIGAFQVVHPPDIEEDIRCLQRNDIEITIELHRLLVILFIDDRETVDAAIQVFQQRMMKGFGKFYTQPVGIFIQAGAFCAEYPGERRRNTWINRRTCIGDGKKMASKPLKDVLTIARVVINGHLHHVVHILFCGAAAVMVPAFHG